MGPEGFIIGDLASPIEFVKFEPIDDGFEWDGLIPTNKSYSMEFKFRGPRDGRLLRLLFGMDPGQRWQPRRLSKKKRRELYLKGVI